MSKSIVQNLALLIASAVMAVMLLLSLTCEAGTYQDDMSELYRFHRKQDEQRYIQDLEQGHQGIRPYVNNQYDRTHGYDSVLEYNRY